MTHFEHAVQASAQVPHVFINGEGRKGLGEVRSLIDPATEQVWLRTRDASTIQVDEAVDGARAALPNWTRFAPGERSKPLFRLAGLIEAHADDLALLESQNVGKPLSQARRDVCRAADYFRFYAGACDKLNGETIPLGLDQTAMTLLDPVGVTAHVLPWNYPISTLARGAAPALAVGATVVAKPSELTPLTAVMVAKFAHQAGVPAGVFNVVCGDGHIGAVLTSHQGIDHVTFTGSVNTGRRVMQAASVPLAGITLELGGKSPVVVLEDADLDAAAHDIARGIFFNAGQVCAAGSRLICQRSIHDDLVARIIVIAQGMEMDAPLNDPALGPLVSAKQLAQVEGIVSRAKEAGLTCVAGGKRAERLGFYYPPTIFTNVPPDAEIAQSEVFGPVLITQVCEDAEDALTLANGTNFGLVAGIYTSNSSKAMQFARRVNAGQVFVNGFLKGGDTVPFGGVKHSGIGREKGLAGLAAYAAPKSIVLNH